MKILIAIPCLLHGGTEKQTLELLKALNFSGNEITVLCYFEYEPEIVSEFENAGSKVICINLRRKSLFLNLIYRIKNAIQTINPDIVHVQYMTPGALPVISARLAGVRKIFATVHQPYTEYHGRFARLILRFASLLTTKFIAVSQNAEKSWFGSSTIFNEKKSINSQPRHFTIHNGVDVDSIQSLCKNTDQRLLKNKLNLSDNCFIIGAVSRLRHEKGIDLLLDAFSILTKHHEAICLLIIGSGPDEEQLKRKVAKYGITEQVIFNGQVSWEQAMKLVSVTDIVVVPSRFEGFGLTAAEAMAAGIAVVASDTSGLKEIIINEETGILFPVDDVNALRTTMERLINDTDLRKRLVKKGKERVIANFSLDIYQQKIRALYSHFS